MSKHSMTDLKHPGSFSRSEIEAEVLGISHPSRSTLTTLTASDGSKSELIKISCNWNLCGCLRSRSGHVGKNISRYRISDLENCKEKLIEFCLTHIQDSYKVHLNRLKGLEILENMMDKSDIEQMTISTAVHMIWACLSCNHHFMLRLKGQHGGNVIWTRRKQAKKAFHTFEKLIHFLEPMQGDIVLQSVITFYDEANLWDIEYLCAAILKSVLVNSGDYSSAINEILNLVENSTLTSPATSCQILQVLWEIEESLDWTLLDDKLISRIVKMYYCSITPEHYQTYNYELLEKGLEICLRGMTRTLEDRILMNLIKTMLELTILEEISDNNLLTFGNILEHICAKYHRTKISHRSMPHRVFPLILKLLDSENLLYSLLGNRVLHHMIDRNNNRIKFDTPRLFFEDAHYNIVLNRFSPDDKHFFREHRELLHSTLLNSILKHGVHKIHLENTYISIALFLVEIPCSYTAAAGVCLAMAIQESALEDISMDMVHAHRLHATVVSLMSLVCYIHKAKVFYDYINTIVDRRAHYAPHLNPPLKSHYKYAQHHVLWNKPELFFEDWEARYGLWKCFRSKLNHGK